MTVCDSLIILHYTKIKDSAIVIHTLSRRWGRRSFLVHLGKGQSLALFQTLSIVQADITENPRSELWKAGKFVAEHPLIGLRQDFHKNAIAMFMGEVLYRTITDGACEDGLFDWCRKSILTLDAMDCDFANFHLRWLLEFCTALGFAPSREDLAPFAGEYFSAISILLSSSFGEAMLLPLNGKERNGICDMLIRYVSHHTEMSLDIRSLRVLRELFS